ncbi:hypothetical protein F0562_004991 [Nyssa sinensis]|uniref:Peptidase metallopeptidase domain-containing protein n=1 Tax=Nyssa sinensis TaxID=561372 RepID=A0A5J5AKG9_9ASTE|nr:hypothetical protein F0562_004991 [Nyssa sinensis]
MATEVSQLISSISLLLLLFPLLSRANSFNSTDEKPSPYEFLKHLQGCHKGDRVQGLHELKSYLENFGYLNYHLSKNNIRANDDDFDDLLESSIKTYQLNYHLKASGVLDAQTISKMMMPRCGVSDIINGNPKWPASKNHLTYGFLSGTGSKAMNPVARAFDQWASATHFTFSQTRNYANADIKIGFHRRQHGDGHPFDGPGGILAHAWSPTDGRFHYDADEVWSIGPVPGAIDLETVALHEIGHLLGLGHSSVKDAIMYPSIGDGVTKGLHGDDIRGILALYNA